MKAILLSPTPSISRTTDISSFSPRTPIGVHSINISFYKRGQTQWMPSDARETSSFPLQSGNSNQLRRVRSETDIIRSVLPSSHGVRLSPPTLFPELEDDLIGRAWKGSSPPEVLVEEEDGIEYSGGSGKGSKSVGGGFGGSESEERNRNRRIRNYYVEMLKADRGNQLLLKNYGRFLHEVERDLVMAEEYYERAILADPSDGETLSLYARLIWDSQKDRERSESYHERAVKASPENCYVLGSYANFLWDEEEVEEEQIVSPALKVY